MMEKFIKARNFWRLKQLWESFRDKSNKFVSLERLEDVVIQTLILLIANYIWNFDYQ